ncbi:hypothetical protein KCP69_15735 [Salmonella enterica subsp. enterica]|nr:hypothetical protein KCP69_15735 [Salmonella enterica subsp. enterica]
MPEANLLAVAHHLEALDFSKEIVPPFSVVKPAPYPAGGGVPAPSTLTKRARSAQ